MRLGHCSLQPCSNYNLSEAQVSICDAANASNQDTAAAAAAVAAGEE
jgi:hypothetical protein